MKNIGKPCAGEPHARFDEGGQAQACSLLYPISPNFHSSSCTVYGEPHAVRIREDFPLQPTSPYGRTKLAVEQLLRDLAASQPGWRIALLRYFNPVGA